jgi:hydrogenase/urease accessory protein HupE
MRRGLFAIILLTLLPSLSVAHEMRPAYLELKQTGEETYSLLFKVPAKGPDQRLALNVRLPLDCETVSPQVSHFTGVAFVERTTIRRGGGLVGAEIQIDGLSSMMTDVLVRLEHIDGATQVERLTSEDPSFVVRLVPSGWEVAKTYTSLGIEHIWDGVDHLLFVACLVLIAGISRRLLWTITGFTLAHSVTLAMAALDVVRLPIPPIEACIALSVVFLASEIARGSKDALSYRYPIVVSSLFGLLHGFGFAAVLQNIGLPANEVATSLLFFNVGVEIGQVLFVAGVIAVLLSGRLIERWTASQNTISVAVLAKAKTPFAYVIGSIATFWMIDRISGF